jgi:hypothetical protein
MFRNCTLHYRKKGKHIFVPNEECERKGQIIVDFGETLELPE